MSEWDAMASLLLRENEQYVSVYELKDFHASILLHLMLASIQSHLGSSNLDNHQNHEGVANVLKKHLFKLLKRFQDNEENLLILSNMLVYYDISGKSKANEQFVKYTTDLFNRCRLEALLQKLCSAWKHWLSASRDGGAMIINDVKFKTVCKYY
jgi:hypothetical protein